MTFLIAWGSLSTGIVMGALWRSLCEKQSRSNTAIGDGSVILHSLSHRREQQQLPRDSTMIG